MENGSQVGTYVAYFFVCLFLLLLAVTAARAYGMIMSLVLMVFLGNSKPTTDTVDTDNSSDGRNPDGREIDHDPSDK